MTQNSGRITRNNRVRGNVFGDYTAGTNDGIFTDTDT